MQSSRFNLTLWTFFANTRHCNINDGNIHFSLFSPLNASNTSSQIIQPRFIFSLTNEWIRYYSNLVQAGVTIVGFPLFFFFWMNSLSHSRTDCVPYVLPGVPPLGAALSALPLSRSSRRVDLGFTHQKGGSPSPLCDVCGGLFPPPLFFRASTFPGSAGSSAGKICHSRFVALPFKWTRLKRREGSRCQEGVASVFGPCAICSNGKKKPALCPVRIHI